MDSDNFEKYPYEIANLIFNDQPAEPKKFQLYCEMEDGDRTTKIDIFEIFMTIMMEGLFIKNNVTCETLKMFNEETILSLQPYLNSLGYQVDVDVINKDDVELYSKFYCRIIMKCDPSWETYFDMHKELMKNYGFIFGANSPKIKGENCNLDNLFAIFSHKNLVYKISFRCI